MYELGFDKRHKELITPVMMNIFPSILQWQCICFVAFIVIPNITNQANAQLGKVKKVFRTSELLETESGYLPETASPKENDAAPFLCEYSQVQDSVCGSFRAECHGSVPSRVPWLPLSMTSAESDMCCSSTKH